MRHDTKEDFAERVRANQQKRPSEFGTRFDYIVCSADTSGCVVAARLAADLKTQVPVLEAGGTDETDLVTNPNRWPRFIGHWPASMTSGILSLPPASISSTLTSGFSANRRATTEPEEPDPQTMKS